MEELRLQTPTISGKIYFGDDSLSARLPALLQGQTNFVLTDTNVYALHKDFFDAYFKGEKIFVLPAGEEYKNFQSLYQILCAMQETNLMRNSRLFAVGGGVIGDIGGLSASLYMRGISCVQIPTTLLAQVDSSVGGKTAVDLDGVKNIIGAFYQPKEVLIAPKFLQTLPAREVKCGLGEIVKYALLDKDILRSLEENTDKLDDLAFLQTLVMPCVKLKAQVVENDEKETGGRKCLNVGHTTGHAIELKYGLSHGEGVLYGAYIETGIAMKKGVCEENYGKRLLKVIKKALAIYPTSAPNFAKIADCLEKAKMDKKNTEQGKVCMSVAQRENEWTSINLPYNEYLKLAQESVYGL